MDLNSIKNKTFKSIIKFSIPSIVAMLLTSMVTVVDGLFIGNYVGKDALVAINLGLPILYSYLAIAIMIGVGGISIAGRFLGSKEFKKSNNVFNQTVTTTYAAVFTMSLLIISIFKPMLGLIDLSDLVRINMLDYYNIMIWTYPIMMLNIVFGMFIRGEGRPEFFLIVTIVNNIINLTLDYIFVELLSLGIKGAAWASFVSVSIGFLMMVLYFVRRSKVFRFSHFSFSKSDFKKTTALGKAKESALISASRGLIVLLICILILPKLLGIDGIWLVSPVTELVTLVLSTYLIKKNSWRVV